MKVAIKFINDKHTQFDKGKEYEADKRPEGYFVNSGKVSKLIPTEDVKEVKYKYGK